MRIAAIKTIFDSKILMVGIIILAIILFGLNLFIGGNTAGTLPAVEILQTTNPEQATGSGFGNIKIDSLINDNFWVMAGLAVAIVLVGGLLLKNAKSKLGAGVASVFGLGLFSLYGLVLVGMVLTLVWAEDYLAYIGDFYQTVAITMMVIGFALIVISKGKFWPLVAMIAIFGYLAFNSPEQTARTIAITQKDGVAAATRVVTAPKPVSAEEQAQRKAVAKQEAEIAAAQRVIAAQAEVEAQMAAERAYEASYLPANAGPCLMRYTDEQDCITVKFEAKTQYDRYSPPGHCIKEDGAGFVRTPLGEGTGWWRYRAENPTIVQFFTASADRCN